MIKKIKSKYIIGYDGTDHEIIKDGEIVYKDDKIVYVGKHYDGHADDVCDAGNSVVSPGFIDMNALGDIDHELVHLEADDANSKSLYWSEEYYLKGSHEVMSKEDEDFKSLYAYTQLILNGVTTAMPITSTFYKEWAETYEELSAAAEHAGRLGLRIYLGPSYQAATRVVDSQGEMKVVYREEEGQKGLARAVKFVQEYDGAYGGLIRGMLAPERVECQTEDILRRTKEYSLELNCPVKLHAAQGLFEYEEIQRRYGKSPIRYLYDIGFLGENIGIPHCHMVSGYSGLEKAAGDDLALLSETNTTVIHCPLVMARFGTALKSFAAYKRRGINMAIGTDTFPPDFFQNIRIASVLSRVHEGNTYGSTYADIFRAATLGGAKLLGREDLGRLCAGAKADMIVIDLAGYHMGTVDDPLRTMIMCGSGRDVKMSVIDGRTVMKDRKIEGVDLKELKERGQQYYDKMKQGYRERDYRHLPDDVLFKPSYKTR